MSSIIADRSREVGEWMLKRMGRAHFPSDAVCVGYERDGAIVAGAAYDNYTGASICMHVVGEGDNWLSRRFLWAIFSYPFDQLKVNKVIGLVPSTNTASVRFNEHLGATLECRIKDAVPRGDLLVYSMTRVQCRYLERDYVVREKRSAAFA